MILGMNPKQLIKIFESDSFDRRILILLAPLAVILFSSPTAFAQQNDPKTESDFTVVTGDEISKNPIALKILKNIEIAKKKFAEMSDAEKQKLEYAKLLEQQRSIAKAKLEKDLASLNKRYEDFTPRNSYARFTAGLNSTHQAIFWDQFNYMNEKIKIATQAKKEILQNGGSFAEAQREFVKYASMSRVEMIKYISDLNIKYGFTDELLQAYFDKYGKLPRFDEDEDAPCYACEKYEKIKEALLAEQTSKKGST